MNDVMLSFNKFITEISCLKTDSLIIASILTYLINPNQLTYSIVILMTLDVCTRVYANSSKAGGFLKAIKNRSITSEALTRKSFGKIVRNTTLIIIANQAKTTFPIELIGDTIYTLLYTFMWFGESISVLENLIDSGWDDLESVLDFFKKKRDDLKKK